MKNNEGNLKRRALVLAVATALAAIASPEAGATQSCANWMTADCTVQQGEVLSGAGTGVHVGGTVGTLTNSGSISGGYYGVFNPSSGVVGAINNNVGGIIDTDCIGGCEAVHNDGTLGTLTNSGTISAGQNGSHSIYNDGTITSVTNGVGGTIGSIGGTIGGSAEIYNVGRWLDTLTNIGTPTNIGTLTNFGTISGANGGISNCGGGNVGSANIGTLINSGTIRGYNTGIMNNGGTIGTVTNSGTISGAGNFGGGIRNDGTIASLTNNSGGVISGIAGINNSFGTIGTLTNNSGGVISGVGAGISNSFGTIGTLINSGTISGTGSAGKGIDNGSTITSLTNNSGGTIRGITAIYNGSIIGTITNSGVIAGNIVNASVRGLTINGGAAGIFGTLTGYNGSIGTIYSDHVVFGSGNLVLNDHVNAISTVQNIGATLQVNTPVTITGNYSQGAGASLLIGVGSGAVVTGWPTDSGYGRLVVSGDATIAAGSSVSLKSQGYAFANGQRYVVVDAAGTGTYNADSLHYSADGFKVSGQSVYFGNHTDLVLTVGGLSTPASPATNPNAIASLAGLARYTGLDPALLNLFNASLALTGGPAAAANHAGVQLGPIQSASQGKAAAAATFGTLDIVSAHSTQMNQTLAASQTGVATGESALGWGAWGQAFGGHVGQGAVDQVPGYGANYGGLLLGADRALGDRWRAGGAFSYSNTSVDGQDAAAGDTTGVNAYGLIAYASYSGSPWYLNMSGGVVQQQYNSRRVISFPGFSGVANGRFSGQQYVVSTEFGYPLALNVATLTPLAGLTYSRLHQNAFTETGGNGAALSVGATNGTSVRSSLGVKLEKSVATAYGELVPSLRLQWTHEYDHTRVVTGASYAADPTGQTAFTTVGATPVSDLMQLSLAVTLLRSNTMSLIGRYDLQAGSQFLSQTGSLQLRQLF
jgi:outer membrane autotransporter protein